MASWSRCSLLSYGRPPSTRVPRTAPARCPEPGPLHRANHGSAGLLRPQIRGRVNPYCPPAGHVQANLPLSVHLVTAARRLLLRAARALTPDYGSVRGSTAICEVLSTIGLYGVVTAHVAGRTSEVGIRMVLGASRRVVRSAVLLPGSMMTHIGMLGGAEITGLFSGWHQSIPSSQGRGG